MRGIACHWGGQEPLVCWFIFTIQFFKKRYQKECTKLLATLSTVVLKLGDRFRGAPCSGDNLIKAHVRGDVQPLLQKFAQASPKRWA